MNIKEFRPKLMQDTLGMSCVENYFIYLLRERGMYPEYFYYKSYISLKSIIYSLVYDKNGFAFFNEIERLHALAQKSGIVTLEYKKTSGVLEGIQTDKQCCLISVNPQFIYKNYGNLPWREDHYIMLRMNYQNHYNYLNDIPPAIGTIDDSEIEKIYQGSIISIDITNDTSKAVCNRFAETFLNIVQNECCQSELQKDFIKSTDITVIRDVIGILKISRNRVKRYLMLYNSISYFDQYLCELDTYYVVCEYMRLRKKVDRIKLTDMFKKIEKYEYELLIELKTMNIC